MATSRCHRSDEAASPALYALCQNGTRAVFYPETSQDQALCAEKIKPMVDDADKTTMRALYSGCRELTPRYTSFLMTNPPIIMDNADDATKRRIFQILFEAVLYCHQKRVARNRGTQEEAREVHAGHVT